MSEYRRQVLLGGIVAITIGVIVIAGVVYLPSGTNPATTTFSETSAVYCSTSYLDGASFGEASIFLAQQSGSFANLCVRFFYYNSSSTYAINSLNQLIALAPSSNSGTPKNDNPFFSISANIPQFQIGGPKNADEGFEVVYTIRSTGSAPTGGYAIVVSSALYPTDASCPYGNNYIVLHLGSTTNLPGGSSCNVFASPGRASVYAEIVGVTNST